MTALQLVWNWRLVSRNRIATKDSLLWAAPQEKNPNILGKAWVGDIVGKLHAMDRKTARATLSVMRDALAQYGEQIGVEADPGAAGSLSSSPSRPEQEFSLGADTDPTTINFANTDFWTKRLDRSGTRDHTGPGLSTKATPSSINQANSDFWDAARKEQATVGRSWGRG